MLGNPFSPRWMRARRRGEPASWEDHCAMNVALRHEGRTAWAMTEHRKSMVARDRENLVIGGNEIAWRDGSLHIRIDERTAPWRTALRGHVRLTPLAERGPLVSLDAASGHVWRATAPFAHVEVKLDAPAVTFRGAGYLDGNQGDTPLEEAFSSWTWSRASSERHAAIAYDVVTRDGTVHRKGITLDRDGVSSPCSAHALVDLPATRFGLLRTMRCQRAAGTRLLEDVEDGPFYARAVVETQLGGRRVLGMHETVSLDRLRSRWVQALVPFRMRVEGA